MGTLITYRRDKCATQLHHVHHHQNPALFTTITVTCFCRILNRQHSGAKLPWIIWLKRQTCVLNGQYVTMCSSVCKTAFHHAGFSRQTFIQHHLPVKRRMEVRFRWALLTRFQTNQGHRASCRKKWGLAATDMCPCGKCRTMSHTVNSPQTKLEGGLQWLHSADDIAEGW